MEDGSKAAALGAIAQYQITAKLGEGGMGQVYRARDSRLGREVALKVLPEVFSNDAGRMARFEREAQLLASLNHPHIATLHGFEESGGVRALVMELVEGPTLAERFSAGPMPLNEALPIAKQIAEALEYAHDKGIVHRDLKPANIKLTEAGAVKLLDFGLAKALDDSPAASNASNSPTLSLAATGAGVILGTAAYMSPEQAKGKPVDRRADIWAFGVVLLEMLTGRQIYAGETVAETLALVITKEPSLDGLPPGTPSAIRKLLARCLDRDPRRRLRDIGEARIAIEDALSGSQPEKAVPVASGPPPERRPWPWVAATVISLLAALGLAVLHFRESPPVQESSIRFTVAAPKNTFGTFHISPNGRYLAMADALGQGTLYVRPLDSLETRPLSGTDGATYPFWSPDSAFIGFFADGKIKKVAVSGGPTETVCDAHEGRGGTWNSDGIILFSPGPADPLYRVPAAGGAPTPVTKLQPPQVGHRFPEFLPDGRHFVFHVSGDAERRGIYAGSLGGGTPVRILADDSNAAFSPAAPGLNGHLLFRREGTLMAQPFDPARLKLTGAAFPVAERVGVSANRNNGAFSVSANGALIFGPGVQFSERQLVWLDRSGRRLGTVGKPSRLLDPALSPDGNRVAFSLISSASEDAGTDIWVLDALRGVTSRFTFGPGNNFNPVWTPDGDRIIFVSSPTSLGRYDIHQRPSSGAGKEELFLKIGGAVRIWDLSRDGKWMVYSPDITSKTKGDLWLVSMQGEAKPLPYLETPFDEGQGQFSPDGRWMAYTSDESGQSQVYVQPIPVSGSKHQISPAGGSMARWSRNGRELYYVSADQKIMAAPVKFGPSPGSFEAGSPEPLFDFRPAFPTSVPEYQPSADGQRFLASVPAEGGSASPPLTVLLHWQAAMQR